jgi:hypothetical protein
VETVPNGNARDLALLAGVRGVGLVIGLVEVVKRTWPRFPRRYVPLVAIALGLVLNLAIGYQTGCDPLTAAIAGLEAGLAAVGLYAVTTRLSARQEGGQ